MRPSSSFAAVAALLLSACSPPLKDALRDKHPDLAPVDFDTLPACMNPSSAGFNNIPKGAVHPAFAITAGGEPFRLRFLEGFVPRRISEATVPGQVLYIQITGADGQIKRSLVGASPTLDKNGKISINKEGPYLRIFLGTPDDPDPMMINDPHPDIDGAYSFGPGEPIFVGTEEEMLERYIEILKIFIDINGAEIPFGAFSDNANRAASTGLKASGLHYPGSLHDKWAPGVGEVYAVLLENVSSRFVELGKTCGRITDFSREELIAIAGALEMILEDQRRALEKNINVDLPGWHEVQHRIPTFTR